MRILKTVLIFLGIIIAVSFIIFGYFQFRMGSKTKISSDIAISASKNPITLYLKNGSAISGELEDPFFRMAR